MYNLSFFILMLTAVITFIFALQVKMYKTNLIGFLIICYVFVNVAIFSLCGDERCLLAYRDLHFIGLTTLIWFICFYNFYKHYIKYKKGKTWEK